MVFSGRDDLKHSIILSGIPEDLARELVLLV